MFTYVLFLNIIILSFFLAERVECVGYMIQWKNQFTGKTSCDYISSKVNSTQIVNVYECNGKKNL